MRQSEQRRLLRRREPRQGLAFCLIHRVDNGSGEVMSFWRQGNDFFSLVRKAYGDADIVFFQKHLDRRVDDLLRRIRMFDDRFLGNALPMAIDP